MTSGSRDTHQPDHGSTTRAAIQGKTALPKLGPYACVRLLGSGGSGSVYTAIDERNQRRVAVKVMRAGDDIDEETRKRFIREAEHARAVHHPNVVEYYDIGWEGDRLYLATELLNGGDAASLCKRYPRGMPAIMIAAIGRDCARGLNAIHAAKLVHRDVKPSNIFLGSTGLAKLGDLGLSRHMHQSTDLTLHGRLVGTPEFMAPEQALAEEELDHRADIYGLGASLYYLATGRAPFEGGSAWAILAQLINDPFPDPRRLVPELREDLATIIIRAGEKDRARRYQSALEMADALEEALSGGDRTSTRRMTRNEAPPRHILIVDDDPIIRRVYRSRFELDKLSVDAAESGTKALEMAAAKSPDLVLLDLMLPDFDGLTLLKRLRQLPNMDKIPVVVFSNAFEEEQQELARVAGAWRVLSKTGCSPRFVSHLVQELLTQSQPGRPPPNATRRFTGQAAGRPSFTSTISKPTTTTTSAANSTGDSTLNDTADVDISTNQIRHLAETSLVRLLVLLRDLGTSTDDRRIPILEEIAGTAHGFASSAGLVQHESAALLAQAVEQLARQLLEWPDRITPSSRRTLAQAVLVLRSLLEELGTPSPLPQGQALVLDDDPTSLRLACQALEKVRIAASPVQDPQAALALLSTQSFSLVLTDVMMQGMNGVQFATRVRAMEAYRQVPLIFVTGLTDFRDRLGAIADLRIDVIAKPFLIIELATKALSLRLSTAREAGQISAFTAS